MKLKKIFGAVNPIGRERRRQIDSLALWVDHITADVEKKYDTLTDANGNLKGGLGYSINIDGSAFTKKELAPVAAAIEKLHDACLAKDISLGIAGFDLLPHQHAVAGGSAGTPYGAQITVSPRETYCLYDHPRSLDLQRAGHKLRMSQPRVLTPAEPAEEAPVPAQDNAAEAVGTEIREGLAEGIAVRRPIVLKQTRNG